MPSYNSASFGFGEEGLAPDHEHWPVGHYRGRGNRQDHTGPNGPWLEGGPSRFMRPPQPRHANAPKNYKRTDERMFEEVCELMTDHGDLDASDIEVFVDDGDVILRGTVRSRWAKYYAEDLAMAVNGVKDVVNELKIARNPDGTELGGPTSDSG